MEQDLDFKNQEKWGGTMDTQAHIKTYKSFLFISLIVFAATFAVLAFMAVFLT